ncbi:metallophosphoesterase [Pedococcus aerophilus]|uniref:metallophosphoesterase n=1 Tax=Pedococcus aerophilus TaxID=436356 RepID=UPI0031E1BA3C
MPSTSRRPLVFAACLALLAGSLVAASPATARAEAPGQAKPGHETFAVIGDVPYGADQVARFPGWIDQINADPQVGFVFHVGDIKNGSTRCDDAYYRMIRTQFERFADPLVYTPGDNEWTDCHRANNGGYDPLERLAFDRSVFFDRPGTTLGAPARVSVPDAAYPENVQLRRAGVSFATLHVVGSNNDLAPWTGLGQTAATPAQVAEERGRMAASIALLRQTFAQATQRHDRAVVVLQQADMFDPTYTPAPTDISAFRPLVQALAEETNRFRGDVYLVNGDSHIYNSDRPLAPGSVWLERYGVTSPAPALERITVDGSDNNKDWLKVTVNRPGAASTLGWTRVPYSG